MRQNRILKCIDEAYSVLDGVSLTRERADELADVKGNDILDLISLANKVRDAFAGEGHVCTILNAQSGQCGEDCRFCAQSAHHTATVDEYPLLDIDTIIERARHTVESGVDHFGIVTSGWGFPKMDETFQRILDAMDALHDAFPELHVCASLGMLSEETAAALAEHHVAHYNINLQTSPEKYGTLIASTHSVEERTNTIRLLKNNAVRVCSGGIIGLGETMSDRLNMAYALKALDVDVIPLNVLVPIPGTPLENTPGIPVAEIAKTFAIFRLIHPRKIIKFAAGRETIMKDFQGLLMLAGANGFLTGGYLTTRGREVAEDVAFSKQLEGFSGASA